MSSSESLSPVILLTVTEAAQRLDLSVSLLNKKRLTGGGPVFVKLGRFVRYSPQDLSQWLDRHKRRSTSDTASGEGQS